VGAIQGSLTVSGLTALSSGRYDIQVTAESLSADGSRHVAVNSAPVNSDGSFVLYPLPTSSTSPLSYDLVIHGPSIATIIIKGVTVNVGSPSTTTPVSVGTIVPRTATSFTVNLDTTSTQMPAGALVGFYQTLSADGEVPYLIEEQPIDAFNRNFAADQSLSAETIDSGTFTSGEAVALSSSTPTEGASTYHVAGTAPLFTDGTLTTTVSAPIAGSSGPSKVAPSALTVASGATSDSITVTVTEVTAGKYNMGDLILSHDGAIVATASLNSLFSPGNGGTLTLSGIPGGSGSTAFDLGIYTLAVRAWNTSNPSTTLNRETYTTLVDLRNGTQSSYTISID
jgi:hypothetical protein